MKVTRVVLALTLIVALSGAAFAQSAEDIVNRHVKMIGGKEKLAAINSVVAKGVFQIPAANMEMQFERKTVRPNKFRMDVISEMGSVITATDGNVAWQVNQFQGIMEPTAMPEEQAQSTIRQANIDGFWINRDKNGIKLEYVGEVDEGGQVYQKVKVMYDEDTSVDAFFEKESGILVKMVAQVEQAGMEMESITTLTDYREENGILSAHRMEQSVMGQNFVIIVNEVSYNVDVDDSTFAMPAK